MMDSGPPSPGAPALAEWASSGPQAPDDRYLAQPLVGGWLVGEKSPGRQVWVSDRVAWPGTPSRRTATSQARPERNSGSGRPGLAWHCSEGHFRIQWKEEACCDPP